MKKIIAITGTRADYGIYKPVFDVLETSSEVELQVVVVGMHLLREFGNTVEQIEQDGFTIIARLDTMTTEDTKRAMAEYVGKTTVECTKVLDENKPDVCFVLGDRGEMLAAATAASYLGIPVAQLHAGEHSGSVDDPVRHAITQLSAMHLCTTDAYAQNVKKMCPNAAHIHTVGAPALDTILSVDFTPKEVLFKRFGFDASKQTVLFLQHPDTTDGLSPREQLSPSLEALQSFDENILIIGSNADAGGVEMNAMLKLFAESNANVHFEISLPHKEFLSCEKVCDVLAGNSSSGIIEAASFNLPVVNIGDRQKGRLRSGNVLDVPYDANAISAGIRESLNKEVSVENIYGNGTAAPKILEALLSL